MLSAIAFRRLLQTDVRIPPSATNATGTAEDGGYAADDTLDNNMVIILAALLCALVCALGLNSIVRCSLRCSHRFGLEDPELSVTRQASKGLKKGRLAQIPVVVYRPEMKIPATDCPICLGEFSEGEKVRILGKCNHGFHAKCIDKWLVSSSSCPICRQHLFGELGEGEV